MLEKPLEIFKGLQIIAKILGVTNVIIAIENNKQDAITLMRRTIINNRVSFLDCKVNIRALPAKYPQGAEKQLISAVLNRDVPYEGLPMYVGVVVHNVGTAFAIYEAVFYSGQGYFDVFMGINSRCAGDSTPPIITNVTSSIANGSYTVGQVIPITVTFSEVVTSTGNVTVTLETGAVDRTCTFTVTNSTSGTCNYTVQVGDTSSDLDVNSISGTIKDTALNSMVNFNPTVNLAANKNIIIDTTVPTVTSVTSSIANGTYKSGQVIPIQVVFSEVVFVPSGNPKFVLLTGSPTVTNLSYTSGSGSNMLVFNYTVGANNYSADLEYGSSSSLAFTGGTIKDTAGNDAILTLPVPGSPINKTSRFSSKYILIVFDNNDVAIALISSNIILILNVSSSLRCE